MSELSTVIYSQCVSKKGREMRKILDEPVIWRGRGAGVACVGRQLVPLATHRRINTPLETLPVGLMHDRSASRHPTVWIRLLSDSMPQHEKGVECGGKHGSCLALPCRYLRCAVLLVLVVVSCFNNVWSSRRSNYLLVGGPPYLRKRSARRTTKGLFPSPIT